MPAYKSQHRVFRGSNKAYLTLDTPQSLVDNIEVPLVQAAVAERQTR
jgi:hypothetical protein